MKNYTQTSNFTVSLSLSAHTKAEHFRKYHTDKPQKAKQVYLNTLAVYAVNFYLECLGFETEPEASLCENPVMQTLMDIADLEVKNYGKLECRPVLPHADICSVPLEVQSERMGYIAVQFNSALTEAKLLGFTETVTSETIPIDQLKPLEELSPYLNQIKPDPVVDLQISSINLSQWLENIIEEGWQSIEALFGQDDQKLALGYRGGSKLAKISTPNRSADQDTAFQLARETVPRVKLIDLGMGTGSPSVVLLVAVAPENDTEVGIRVQVHPPLGQTYLPANLNLALLSDTGETLREIPSRRLDNFIQLPYFRCRPGERFSLQLKFNQAQVTEDFVV